MTLEQWDAMKLTPGDKLTITYKPPKTLLKPGHDCMNVTMNVYVAAITDDYLICHCPTQDRVILCVFDKRYVTEVNIYHRQRYTGYLNKYPETVPQKPADKVYHTYYEEQGYVYPVQFWRTKDSQAEWGFLINEDVLLDNTGKPVKDVYNTETREDIDSLHLRVPFVVPASDPLTERDRLEVTLVKLSHEIALHYESAKERQTTAHALSGRMKGLAEALEIIEQYLENLRGE